MVRTTAIAMMSVCLSGGVACVYSPVAAQETGMSLGLPNSSPGVVWPRLMGIDVMRPEALYPNGKEFGLGTTAGGFGSSGTAALTGIGLERRGLGGLEAEEASNRFGYQMRLRELFSAESMRSSGLFSAALSNRLSSQTGSHFTLPYSDGILNPSAFPGIDRVLNDRAPDSNSILQTDLR